jgi:hypothetical protein
VISIDIFRDSLPEFLHHVAAGHFRMLLSLKLRVFCFAFDSWTQCENKCGASNKLPCILPKCSCSLMRQTRRVYCHITANGDWTVWNIDAQ